MLNHGIPWPNEDKNLPLEWRIIYMMYIDKKENTIFPMYKESEMGSSAKSYVKKGFLIYEEMRIFAL